MTYNLNNNTFISLIFHAKIKYPHKTIISSRSKHCTINCACTYIKHKSHSVTHHVSRQSSDIHIRRPGDDDDAAKSRAKRSRHTGAAVHTLILFPGAPARLRYSSAGQYYYSAPQADIWRVPRWRADACNAGFSGLISRANNSASRGSLSSRRTPSLILPELGGNCTSSSCSLSLSLSAAHARGRERVAGCARVAGR